MKLCLSLFLFFAGFPLFGQANYSSTAPKDDMITTVTKAAPGKDLYAKDLFAVDKTVARIAVRLFGWRWFYNPKYELTVLYPPIGSSEFERTNFNPSDWIELGEVEFPDTRLASDWFNGGWHPQFTSDLLATQTAEQQLRQFPPFFVEYTLAIVQEALKPVPGEKINEPSVLIGQLLALSPYQRVMVLGQVLEKNPGFYWKPIQK